MPTECTWKPLLLNSSISKQETSVKFQCPLTHFTWPRPWPNKESRPWPRYIRDTKKVAKRKNERVEPKKATAGERKQRGESTYSDLNFWFQHQLRRTHSVFAVLFSFKVLLLFFWRVKEIAVSRDEVTK